MLQWAFRSWKNVEAEIGKRIEEQDLSMTVAGPATGSQAIIAERTTRAEAAT